MIRSDVPITPALYGIIDSHLSITIIDSKWSAITENILNRECEIIYGFAFKAILIAREYSGSKRKGFQLFKGLLIDYYEDEFLKSEEDLLKAVFDFYWQIHRSPCFWETRDIRCATIGHLITCVDAIEKWKSEDSERVEDAISKLKAWSSTK